MVLCPSTREVELQAQYHRRIKAGDVEAAMSLDTPSYPSPDIREQRKDPLPFGQKRGLSPDISEDKETASLGDIQQKILNYYRGTFFAGPTAGEVYQLLRQMKLETRQSVWEWSVGLSDQLLHLRCTEEAYEAHFENLSEELGRLERKAEKGEEAKEQEDDLEQNQEENTSKVQTTGKKPKAGSIYRATSIKAPLLRFSTLRRAIEMSPYFYANLRLERRDGKAVLDQLLVRLGISLQDADQKYPFTKAKMGKGRLKELLQKAEIRMQNFQESSPTRSTLKRQFGHNFSIDSIDYALAVASTLQNPNALMKEFESKGAKEWGFGEQGITPFNADDQRQRGQYQAHLTHVLDVIINHQESNFVLAYELVREKKAQTVQKAIDAALESTVKIASAAGLLLEKKGAIFKLKHYCEGTLLAGKHTDGFIHTPLAQLRLLDFVREVYSKKVPDPLILIIIQNPHTLALSAAGSPSSEMIRFDGQPMARNPWNQYFSQLDAPLIQGGPQITRRYIDPNFREVPMHDHLSFVIELSKLNATAP